MSTNHVSVRLDTETMARVDALAPAFSTEWRPATRSDILRGLILDALDRFEHGAARGHDAAAGHPRRAKPRPGRAGAEPARPREPQHRARPKR